MFKKFIVSLSVLVMALIASSMVSGADTNPPGKNQKWKGFEGGNEDGYIFQDSTHGGAYILVKGNQVKGGFDWRYKHWRVEFEEDINSKMSKSSVKVEYKW